MISIRRVDWAWEHPKDKDGNYIPLFDMSYKCDLADWNLGKEKWAQGYMQLPLDPDDIGPLQWVPIPPEHPYKTFEEAFGSEPIEADYRPDWQIEFCTCYQLYDESSLIPMSPVFETARLLAIWIKEHIDGELIEKYILLPELPFKRRLLKSIKRLWGVYATYSTMEECNLANQLN